MGLATNYKKVDPKDAKDIGKVRYYNQTGSTEHQEVISIEIRDIPAVSPQIKPVVNLPSKKGLSNKGQQITIRLEEKKRMTSSTDDAFIVDYPSTLTLSYNVTGTDQVPYTDYEAMVKRLLGLLYNEDGTTNFQALFNGQAAIA
jgi:hypothetical protein